jgi:ATP-dependent HslUV protease subunit HslV
MLTVKILLLIHIYIAAAKALVEVEGMDAETIGRKAMKIAADLCVYTNHEVMVEILNRKE